MRSKLNPYTRKQKELIMALLAEPSFNSAAERLGITKRSVYRRARGIKNRLAREGKYNGRIP